MTNFDPWPRMIKCVECGEDVPVTECYEDSDEYIHAIGVTGLVEPHETGTEV